jgi:cellobiose-specific phosphotransferase system component IIC
MLTSEDLEINKAEGERERQSGAQEAPLAQFVGLPGAGHRFALVVALLLSEPHDQKEVGMKSLAVIVTTPRRRRCD